MHRDCGDRAMSGVPARQLARSSPGMGLQRNSVRECGGGGGAAVTPRCSVRDATGSLPTLPPPEGQVIKLGRHGAKVLCIAAVPAGLCGVYNSLWWTTGASSYFIIIIVIIVNCTSSTGQSVGYKSDWLLTGWLNDLLAGWPLRRCPGAQ